MYNPYMHPVKGLVRVPSSMYLYTVSAQSKYMATTSRLDRDIHKIPNNRYLGINSLYVPT